MLSSTRKQSFNSQWSQTVSFEIWPTCRTIGLSAAHFSYRCFQALSFSSCKHTWVYIQEENGQKTSSRITGKTTHWSLKTRKKKNQNNWKQSKVWLFQSTVSSGTLCCNYLHIPDSQTDVVQSFVVDFVEHITSVPTGTHLACFQAE